MSFAVFKKVKTIHYGLLITLITTGLYSYDLLFASKKLYLIGETSHGHYQIELSCDSCHTEAFSGTQALQKACMNCHGAELEIARDTHPKSKFTDPRNTELLISLDARHCITCHQEHRPEITRPMGVTLANDFCFHCHQDIEEDVPSHTDFKFDSCANAGCHNFHDNRALYEDFLAKHLKEPSILYEPYFKFPNDEPKLVLPSSIAADINTNDSALLNKWQTSLHAHKDVNCSNCHNDKDGNAISDPLQLNLNVCQECHQQQSDGFLAGKHGMRLSQNLPPMTPEQARASMHENSHHKTLNCSSCHNPHSTDTQFASVEACLSCHSDEHSSAFKTSPHYLLWQQEQNQPTLKGTGVSCASCHLPRKQTVQNNKTIQYVEHNQNDNLRPNEKMLRDVCMNCHGLEFALKALADPALIQTNFKGKPNQALQTMDMVRKRAQKKQ